MYELAVYQKLVKHQTLICDPAEGANKASLTSSCTSAVNVNDCGNKVQRVLVHMDKH